MDDTTPDPAAPEGAAGAASHETTVLDDLHDTAGSEALPDGRPPQTHPLDLFSLVTGLLAVVGATLYLLGELTDLDVRPALVVAAAVVVLGGAGVVLAVRRDA